MIAMLQLFGHIFHIYATFFSPFQYRSGPPTTAPKTVTPKTVPQKSTEENSKFPESIGPTQPFLALPTTPIIIIPYSLIRGANILPGPLYVLNYSFRVKFCAEKLSSTFFVYVRSVAAGITNPDMSCYVLQNGALQPIAQAISVANVSQERAPSKPPSVRAQTPVAKLSQPNESESVANHHDVSKSHKRKDTQNRQVYNQISQNQKIRTHITHQLIRKFKFFLFFKLTARVTQRH